MVNTIWLEVTKRTGHREIIAERDEKGVKWGRDRVWPEEAGDYAGALVRMSKK